jgi:hypothetical protein
MKGLFFPSLLFLMSCTATKITSTWSAPEAGAKDYKKIMVVSVIQNEDSVMRRNMEQQMVADLKAIGYNAVAFTDEFKTGDLQYMRYDSVRQRLTSKEIDGVIITSLLAKDKERIYVKDKSPEPADHLPLGTFWETSTAVKQDMGKPGYYLTSAQYYWESHFYDVKSLALLYNARSTAFEVTSAESLARKYGKVIVNDMQKHYLLTAKN